MPRKPHIAASEKPIARPPQIVTVIPICSPPRTTRRRIGRLFSRISSIVIISSKSSRTTRFNTIHYVHFSRGHNVTTTLGTKIRRTATLNTRCILAISRSSRLPPNCIGRLLRYRSQTLRTNLQPTTIKTDRFNKVRRHNG